MYVPVFTKQFQRDVKRAKRRGKNLDKFRLIADTLLAGDALDSIHRDHGLVGNYTGRRECHIESDWLLIYRIDAPQLVFERMGTHADLFKS